MTTDQTKPDRTSSGEGPEDSRTTGSPYDRRHAATSPTSTPAQQSGDHALDAAEERIERAQPLISSPMEFAGAQRTEVELLQRTAEEIDGSTEASTPTPEAAGGTAKWRLYLRRFLRNPTACAGVVIFLTIALFGAFGELLVPYKYTDVDFLSISTGPDAKHWFGTNGAGNDLFAALAHGVQRSMIIGLLVSLLTTAIAAVVGSLAAYLGGIAERVILEIIHFLLVLPTFLLLLMVAQATSGDWRLLIVVLTLFGWMFYARVVWTLALSLREREYVAAARYMGLGAFPVVIRHIIPNIGSLLTIHFTLGVVQTVQSETAISFLGFGVKPPDTSLGVLIRDGTGTLISAPWAFWIPAITLTILTVSMAFIADGLRDALDPNSQAGGKA